MPALPPGPRDRAWGMTLARRFRAQPLDFITQVSREFGDLAYFRFGPVRVCFVNQPRLIREVLVTGHKNYRRPEFILGPLRAIDGNGLVLSDGDFWQRQRRLVQPAFATRRFDHYGSVTVDFTERMLARWSVDHHLDLAQLDIADEMTRLTLHIIARSLFDLELSEDQAALLGEAVRAVSETVTAEAGTPIRLPDWLPTAFNRRKRFGIRTLDTMVWNAIRARRAAGDDRGDLLSMLLLAVDEEGDQRGMTDKHARDEAMTLFNAGHDSTAAALAWIFYLVAKHPAVAARLVDEFDGVLAGRSPTYADVARLPYADLVVKESLRLYPPTWTLLPREALTDVELAGYRVPRGTWLYIFPWVTHRDGRYFEHPEKFDPDRFGPGRADQIPQYAYLPFGAGPRACIGHAFATMEMILILATVMQRVRIKLAPGQHDAVPEPLISIRPRGGLRVSVTRRAKSVPVGEGAAP